MRNGIFSSLRQILEKRVLPSLYPLFDSPKLDRELRSKIRETFKEFCLPPNAESGKILILIYGVKSNLIFKIVLTLVIRS